MLSLYRLLWVGLLCTGISIATTAQAGTQLFEASWTIKAFGNELTGGTGASKFYEAYRQPQSLLCNPVQPRCPFTSTPTDGYSYFQPLGGSRDRALFCAPWYNWAGKGTSIRPAKGQTDLSPKNGRPIPPLYRNPAFFTEFGQPETYSCLGTSTDGFGGPGPVQLGNPITGRWSAVTTGTQRGGFTFGAAPTTVPAGLTKGFRATGVVGEFGPVYPYVYSYTYATLRNDYGLFGPGSGPGSFSLPVKVGGTTVAKVKVTEGAAKFGGTMRMLGAMTAKACYYREGGCSLGSGVNWRYEAAGASANVNYSGVVTEGYLAFDTILYYHTALMQSSAVVVRGSRFPWTTGTVTVTATGRGPHKTIHYSHGYDNRNTTTPDGLGTIQLVTPLLTRWSQPAFIIDTGGIGILRLKFLPEPRTWAMLVAGVALLGVSHRMRGR